MKIRDGFVSNSSSSSFIIGLGKVSDLNKFEALMKKKNLDFTKPRWDLCASLHSLRSIKENETDLYDLKLEGNDLILECEYSGRSINLDVSNYSDDDKIFVLQIHNNEGDCDSELTEAVYEGQELSLDYFGEQASWVTDISEKHGIQDWTVTYGCARNG